MGNQLGAPPLTRRRQRQQHARAEADPVCWTLRELTRHGLVAGEASATAWLDLLDTHASDPARSNPAWPKNPAQLGRSFSKISESLAFFGLNLSFRRVGRVRLWRLETLKSGAACRHSDRIPLPL